MEINIKVEEVKKDGLYLNQEFGKGVMGKLEFSAHFMLPNMALIVEVNDKKYRVNQTDIIEQIINQLSKNHGK